MTKTINMTYDKFIKSSDQGFRNTFKKMGMLGEVFLTGNGGSGYKRMFENYKKDVQNKIRTNQIRFVGSSPRSTTRNPRSKRRSLMNRAS